MAKKRKTQREIGFIQGMAYAAALQADWGADAYDVISQSGIPTDLIRKYATDCDVEKLKDVLESVDS